MPESSTPVVPSPLSKGGDTDPSALATQALWREVAHLKELLTTVLDANQSGADKEIGLVRDVIETRMDANDRAVRLLQDGADRFPALIDEKITALRAVHDEKFGSVQKQFEERDVRTDTSRISDKTAVDAALQAQKESAGKQAEAFQEATNKSEQQFTKQIDQQSELLKTEVRALVAQIGDLKSRFERGEGRGEGAEKQVIVQHAASKDNQWLIGIIIVVLVAAITLGINLAFK